MWKEKPKKVLAAICIATLIAIVLVVVFFTKERYRQPVDKPQEMAAEEPGSKLNLEEATREQLVKQQEERSMRQPKQGDVVTNSIGMKLVYIPAGSFMMGSPSNEKGRLGNEGPQHEVHITEGFWMGQTEVTQGQYKSVMNTQPWSGRVYVQEDDNNPAVYVDWDEATEFCRKLSQQEGNTYRLPTEAEWEYACRAGTTTRFSFGDDNSSLGDYAWYYANTYEVNQKYAHPVGQKKPNPWGLYDMHCNVWEWCSDWYNGAYYSDSPNADPKGPPSGNFRSRRGGSWKHLFYQRCASRLYSYPGVRDYTLGFRVVRSQP